MIDQLNQWSSVWASVMWNVAWQSILLAAAVGVCCWLLRRESPGLRYALWLALSLKLLLLPAWGINVPAPAWLAFSPQTPPPPVTSPFDPGLVASATSQPLAAIPIPNAPPSLVAEPFAHASSPAIWSHLRSVALAAWLMLAWAVVAALAIARIAWQLRALRRMLAAARPADPAVTLIVEQCAARLGLKRLPTVSIHEDAGSPMVCGLRRHAFVLPSALVEQIDRPVLQQIALHELAHLQRRDLLTVWAIQAMRTAYWFNPIAHWIAYRAGLDRELACDRLAMINSGASATAYARTLIDAAAGRSQPLVLHAATAARLSG